MYYTKTVNGFKIIITKNMYLVIDKVLLGQYSSFKEAYEQAIEYVMGNY